MQANVKSFWIRSGAEGTSDEAELAAFLRGVDVLRLETAYDQGWRVLVLYSDMRNREEAQQIRQAIRMALDGWRRDAAKRGGLSANAVLTDSLLDEIASAAPTTLREMQDVLGKGHDADGHHLPEIIQIVSQTLRDLSSQMADVNEPGASL